MIKYNEQQFPFPELRKHLEEIFPDQKFEDLRNKVISVVIEGKEMIITYNTLLSGIKIN